MLIIPTNIISEVADAIETVEKLDIKVDWVDRIFQRDR